MQITDGQTNETALGGICDEAVRLLWSGDMSGLAARFGYALAFGREPELAIRDDLASCLDQLQSTNLVPNIEFTKKVKFFEPNDSSLFALVECIVPTINGCGVLVELVVTSNGPCRYVTLEQISAIA